jgi:polar amino acid transport system substrate-binding protein
VLDAASVPYQINLYPWNRSYNLAINNENVLIYSIFKTSARKDHFHWVCPLPDPLINKIYKLSSRYDIKIEQSEDLKKHKVNAVKGTFPHERLSEMGFSEVSNLQLTMTNDNSLLLLLSGRVDLIVEVDQAVHSKLNSLGYKDNVIEAVYTFQNQPASCMAISKSTSKSIVEKIQQAHRQLLRNKSS